MKNLYKTFRSWGGRTSIDSLAQAIDWRTDEFASASLKILPFGMGRSYGDSCLLDQGVMLETRRLNHLISFDAQTGIVCCEAGCSLEELLATSIPRGWFIPVSPGTKFVTMGGCLANDVHGKNHHNAGTFGCHVIRFALRRSDGTITECSLEENPELFCATIGGLGLTGLILWLAIQLKPIVSPYILQKKTILKGIDSFFEVAEAEEAQFEYSVAWLDLTHEKNARGVFLAGNFDQDPAPLVTRPRASFLAVPRTLPDFILGTQATKTLNTVYYYSKTVAPETQKIHYEPFFYPLDRIKNWNLAYGKKGLIQYQFVVPRILAPKVLSEVIKKTHSAQQSSFLTVVKSFGAIRSPGLLSFPRPGITVCLDLPNLGSSTVTLVRELDQIIFSSEGALYPAKDSLMNAEAFQKSYPNYVEFKKWIDPAFSSNFSLRVGLTP